LLRCSLTSRADNYTPQAFEALMLLRREQEALGLAELLTDLQYKINIFCQIAKHLGEQPSREQERLQLLMRAYEIGQLIKNPQIRVDVLLKLAVELAKIRQWEYSRLAWEQADMVILSIEEHKTKDRVLQELGVTLIESEQWETAQKIVGMIRDDFTRSRVC